MLSRFALVSPTPEARSRIQLTPLALLLDAVAKSFADTLPCTILANQSRWKRLLGSTLASRKLFEDWCASPFRPIICSKRCTEVPWFAFLSLSLGGVKVVHFSAATLFIQQESTSLCLMAGLHTGP
jgi:hypothetical protein